MLNESEKIHSHQIFYNIHLCTILTRCFICVISYIFRSTSNYSPSKYIFPVFSSMGVGVLTDTPTTTLHKKLSKRHLLFYIQNLEFFFSSLLFQEGHPIGSVKASHRLYPFFLPVAYVLMPVYVITPQHCHNKKKK